MSGMSLDRQDIEEENSGLSIANYIYQRAWKKRLIKKVVTKFSLSVVAVSFCLIIFFMGTWVVVYTMLGEPLEPLKMSHEKLYQIFRLVIPTMWGAISTRLVIRALYYYC